MSKESAVKHDTAGSIITSSLYVGGGTGALGAAFSAFHATLRGLPPVVWSTAAGAQCFVLGSTFWVARSALRHRAAQSHAITHREDLLYSSLAGSFAGMTGGAIRGRGHIVPGAIVLGLVGLTGQVGLSTLSTIVDSPQESEPLLDRLSKTSWWPLKSISDEDYEHTLTEKIIRIEAEMAMIDDKITALRSQSTQPGSNP